jgi:hypothetical protein
MTVDGEAITPDPDGNDSDGQEYREELRMIQLELKLCKALLMLSPPPELSAPLHARMAANLRKLPRYEATDPATRQATDLDEDELREAAGIIRAIRAMPTWPNISYYGGTHLRTSLGLYALDIADEIDKRGRDKS